MFVWKVTHSDDHYIYYCWQESLRRNGVALRINKKSLKCSTWVQFQKWQNVLGSFLRQTIQYHSNRSLCPNHYFWGSWSWMVLWRPTRPSRTNTQKRCPFYHRGLECKNKKSINTWSNRKIWPWSTKWNRAKVNKILTRDCTVHSKQTLSTPQKTTLHMAIARWSTLKSDWLYSLQPKMETLYTVSKNKTRSWLAQIMNSLLPNSDWNWRE